MIKQLTTGLAAFAVLTAAVGLATPSLAREVIGEYSKSEKTKMVIKNNGTVKTTTKTTVSNGGHSTTTKTKTKTR
jgi:hypothetical protein